MSGATKHAQAHEQTRTGFFALFLHSQTGEVNSSTEKTGLSPRLNAKILSHFQRLENPQELEGIQNSSPLTGLQATVPQH